MYDFDSINTNKWHILYFRFIFLIIVSIALAIGTIYFISQSADVIEFKEVCMIFSVAFQIGITRY